MAKPLLILHVGPHKTGSTALQYRLLNARQHLLGQGFDYPLFGISQFAHHRIYSFLNGEGEAAQDVNEASIRSSLTANSNVVLSSESFIYLSAPRLLQLKELLQGYDVQVVIFIRSPVYLWPSHWQELVKHGRDDTLLEYLGAYFGLTSAINPVFNHPVSQARRFSQVFGRENIRMFCYDNMVHERIDIFDFFLEHVLRIARCPMEQSPALLNRSLKPDTSEMLRCLNEQHRMRTGASAGARIAPKYLKLSASIEGTSAYTQFRESFETHGLNVTLDSDTDLFRNRDRLLLNTFGDRIENRAGHDRLFAKEYSRTLKYGVRFWADRYGMTAFVAEIMEKLQLQAA